MTDLRRELSLINKHIRQHNREAGDRVFWYQFLALGSGSTYDDIYDEGAVGDPGLSFAPAIVIPTVYVEETEDEFTSNEEGRQPTQTMQLTFLYQDVLRAGMSTPWEYQSHLNDMFSYDSRFYRVSSYKIRGRAPSDVLLVVKGYEIYTDQSMVWDNPPVAATPEDHYPSTFPALG
jgi:hypothetical protein